MSYGRYLSRRLLVRLGAHHRKSKKGLTTSDIHIKNCLRHNYHSRSFFTHFYWVHMKFFYVNRVVHFIHKHFFSLFAYVWCMKPFVVGIYTLDAKNNNYYKMLNLFLSIVIFLFWKRISFNLAKIGGSFGGRMLMLFISWC